MANRRYWKAKFNGRCSFPGCGRTLVPGETVVTRATKKMGGGIVCSHHYYTPVFARKVLAG